MENKTIRILKETEALLEGHFLLSSGKHSEGYVQCAKVLRFPDKAAAVLEPVVEKIKDLGIQKVVGPAMGGVIVSYELGRQLGVEAVFTERKDGVMELRRGFEILPGEKVIIAEDVVTTGKSTLETKEVLEALGAQVVGVACIADRRGEDMDIGMPVYASVKLFFPTYDPEDCPACKRGEQAEKPGSRGNM